MYCVFTSLYTKLHKVYVFTIIYKIDRCVILGAFCTPNGPRKTEIILFRIPSICMVLQAAIDTILRHFMVGLSTETALYHPHTLEGDSSDLSDEIRTISEEGTKMVRIK